MALTAPKSEAVRAMFTRIAARYDLMNSLMTGGRHHAWRTVAARETVAAPSGPVLDLATGTADLALAVRALDPARAVIGADFAEAMLHEAARKPAVRSARITLLAADALRLPFAHKTFAAVTSAFLLRNLEDLAKGLEEMRRVTRPGGRVVTLDITRPATPVWSQVFSVYFHRVVPAIGAAVAGDRQAYTYLPTSVDRFVSPDELSSLMRKLGFREARYRRLGLGTIAIHTALV
ncbi:MAG: ubiquinone/menaquinone biosynthesis methyltransferase [Candidatus Rokubacteria bacterium]|nr:ubiquinone/menaquinone biosynthesis methyltransferase [Candidatus Rokubacteria bacterium]